MVDFGHSIQDLSLALQLSDYPTFASGELRCPRRLKILPILETRPAIHLPERVFFYYSRLPFPD